MRNYGTHQTAKAGYRCFNAELIETMVDTLESQWDHFSTSMSDNADRMEREVKSEARKLLIQLSCMISRIVIPFSSIVNV